MLSLSVDVLQEQAHPDSGRVGWPWGTAIGCKERPTSVSLLCAVFKVAGKEPWLAAVRVQGLSWAPLGHGERMLPQIPEYCVLRCAALRL